MEPAQSGVESACGAVAIVAGLGLLASRSQGHLLSTIHVEIHTKRLFDACGHNCRNARGGLNNTTESILHVPGDFSSST